ncbi:hypothetical protein Tco_0757743 [Tanacetum coccineum]
MLGPEDPQTPPVPQDEDEREPIFIQAHDPDYVPEPIYPEYIPLEDDHEFPTEEQPLPPIDSPTTDSPGYVTESDPEEDPEEYEDDETEDGRFWFSHLRENRAYYTTTLHTVLWLGIGLLLTPSFHIPSTEADTEVERLLGHDTIHHHLFISPPSEGSALARGLEMLGTALGILGWSDRGVQFQSKHLYDRWMRSKSRVVELLSSHERDTQDFLDDPTGDRYGWWRRRPMLTRGWVSLDTLSKSTHQGASDPSCSCVELRPITGTTGHSFQLQGSTSYSDTAPGT